MDPYAAEIQAFWALWPENHGLGQGTVRDEAAGAGSVSVLGGGARCHQVLGEGRPLTWDDRQTAAVMALFHRQRRALPVFGAWVEAVRSNADSIRYPEDLIFMPVEAFLSPDLYHGLPQRPQTVFRSSGTSSGPGQRSQHWIAYPEMLGARSLRFALQNLGGLEDRVLLALLPSYMERGDSSLLYMLQYFMNHGGLAFGAFYHRNYFELMHRWKQAHQEGHAVLAWGIPHALVEWLSQHPFEAGSLDVLIETGGHKGMEHPMTATQMRHWLKARLGPLGLGSEYGMTELGSQAYWLEGGQWEGLVFPESVAVGIYRVDNPLEWEKAGGQGGINVFDPANYFSLAFIQTRDLGRILPDGSLELLGRISGAEPRGCNWLFHS